MTSLENIMIHRLKVFVMIDAATTTSSCTVVEVIQVVAISGTADILVLIITVVVEAVGVGGTVAVAATDLIVIGITPDFRVFRITAVLEAATDLRVFGLAVRLTAVLEAATDLRVFRITVRITAVLEAATDLRVFGITAVLEAVAVRIDMDATWLQDMVI
jgi:hypothetical protein